MMMIISDLSALYLISFLFPRGLELNSSTFNPFQMGFTADILAHLHPSQQEMCFYAVICFKGQKICSFFNEMWLL